MGQRQEDGLLDNVQYCSNCGTVNSIGANVCKNCQVILPTNTIDERMIFYQQQRISQQKRVVSSARNVFFLLGAFGVILTFVRIQTNEAIVWEDVVLSGIYVLLGIASYRFPAPSFLLGMVFYIGIMWLGTETTLGSLATYEYLIHTAALGFMGLGLYASFQIARLRRQLYAE